VSSSPGQDHRGGIPPLWTMGALQRHLTLQAVAPTLFVFVLAITCTMLHQDLTPSLAPSPHPGPYMQPHFTPTSFLHTPLHPIAISVLAINSLSWARYWASSRQPLRIERPSTFIQTTQLTPTNTQTPHPLAKYTKQWGKQTYSGPAQG